MSDLELATMFHETYERLAPSFGYETREDTKNFDPESKNGKLMLAVLHEFNNLIALSNIEAQIEEVKRWRMFFGSDEDLVTAADGRLAELEAEKQRLEGLV